MFAPKTQSSQAHRQIVSSTLKDILSAAQLATVLEIFDQEFAHHNNFPITEFVARIDIAINLGERKNGVRVLLARNLDVVRAGAPGKSGDTPDAVVVFSALMNKVIDVLNLSDSLKAMALQGTVAKGLPAAKLDPGFKNELKNWCRGDAQAFRVGSSEKEMASIVHGVYVWCCNSLGPVAADNLFARAIREAEAVPQAAQFSPRRLL